MKSFKFLLGVALVGLLFTYSGCGKDSAPAPSATDQQLVKLTKSWKISGQPTLDNVQQTGYSSFVLTVTSTPGQTTFGYSTAGRPPGSKSSPWNSSGTFTFGTNVSTQLIRDDALPITYAVSDTQLQITFSYAGLGFDARANAIKGNWVYVFTPQ